MYENNEATPAKPSYEELEAKASAFEQQCKNLETQLAKTEEQLGWAIKSRDSHIDLYRKASNFVQASIDNGDWEDEDLDEVFWTELADLLDLKLTREVEVTIRAIWTATIEMPRGKRHLDVSDLEASVDDPDIDDAIVQNVWLQEITIEED